MKNKDQYFQHDYNAYNDPKIVAFSSLSGATGYGVYWRIVEILHSSDEWLLPKKEYIYLSLAKQMSTSVEQIKEIINHAITCELFEENDYCIWSNRVCENMKKRKDISELRSKAGKISALKRTSVEQVLTSVEQNPTKESKVKESKVNNKEKDKKEIPTSEEVRTMFYEYLKTIYKDEEIDTAKTDGQIRNLIRHYIGEDDVKGVWVKSKKNFNAKSCIRKWIDKNINAYKLFGKQSFINNNSEIANINITTWDNLLKAITDNIQGKGIHIGNLLEAVKGSNSKGYYEGKTLNQIYGYALKMSDKFKIKKKEYIKPNQSGQKKISNMLSNIGKIDESR